MSTTISALDAANRPLTTGATEPDTACLCAQLASSWDIYLEGSDRAELAACANLACPLCDGTGVEPGRATSVELNLCGANAAALLGLLGLAIECGSASLPDARRAIMRARATFGRRAGAFTREAAHFEARPTVVWEGCVARLVPGAVAIVGGLDEEGLRERLERFAAFVERAGSLGAVQIAWG